MAGEDVQVTGEVSQINLASAEKAGTISMTQLQNVAVKGRDMFAYMITIPGVMDDISQARETTSPDSLRGTFINGSRENSKNYAVDGITNLDTGSNNTLQFEPNMDSIAEVKVMTTISRRLQPQQRRRHHRRPRPAAAAGTSTSRVRHVP